jgi:hypothetical protein
MLKHGKYNLVFWIGLVFMHCEQNIKIGIVSSFDFLKVSNWKTILFTFTMKNETKT